MPDLKDLTYSERLRALNLTTLAYRRQRNDVIQVYRIVNKIDNIPFETFFKKNERNRGHSLKLVKPRANSKIRQNSFSNRVIDHWNDLSESDVMSSDLIAFKTAIEKKWENSPIKYNFE